MSIHRAAARRDTNEPEIVNALECAGAKVYRMSQPCDLLVEYHGVIYLGEVKTATGTYTKAQKTFREKFGHIIHEMRTIKQALTVIGAASYEFEFEVEALDDSIWIYLDGISDTRVTRIIEAIQGLKGVGQITGMDDAGVIMVWPKRGRKVVAVAERVRKALAAEREG